MIPQLFVESIDLGDGRSITIETGRLAKQADGSVVVRIGKTVILGTVVSSRKASPGIDFLPLTVDYREKFAAAGRFPGGFFKREARPSDNEVLTMRLVDRVLRPLFPSDYHAEVQVMIQLMSHDDDVMPDALAGLAASAALALSDIPFETLISEARVGRIDGKFIINPSRAQLELSDIDMMIGASTDSIAMVEGEMKEISEAEMVSAIKFAHEHIKNQIAAQERLANAFGKKQVRTYETEKTDNAIYAKVKAAAYDKIYAIASKGSAKQERSAAFDAVKEEVKALFTEEELAENGDLVSKYFYKTNKEAVRNVTLDLGTRLDGRKTTEIRPIWCEVDYLPSVHGSALFTRGETQALATATLGTSREANQIDSPSEQGEEKFYLHYNFPPFSTGEARPLRGTSRREVGHGNLAQRALKNMIPADCPYTIRVVSEVLESNGSSSMASVCGGSLALMDAGMPLKAHVAGIALGLSKEGNKFAVLSDILGDEDHLGDMDFKVAGTANGITALQMDIKIQGITKEIMQVALAQAKEGRVHILGKMQEAMPHGRTELSNFAPRLITIRINPEKIRDVIGKGGAVIRALTEETGTQIDLTDEGIVTIASVDAAAGQEAKRRVEELTASVEVGKNYDGVVLKLLDFGAIVQVMPGKDGLLHISQIANERVNAVADYLKEGQQVRVKVLETDDRGRLKLSMKAVLAEEFGDAAQTQQ